METIRLPFSLHPCFLLTAFMCAGIDIFKLVPLYYIYINRKRRTHIIDFFFLAIGDIAFVFVDSTKDSFPLTLGLFSFLMFIFVRFFREIEAGITRHWPATYMLVTELLCLCFCPVSHLLLDIYAYTLLFLLVVPLCRLERHGIDRHIALPWRSIIGYLLYAISDLLLVISLNITRFWGDWYLVRMLYWMGIATLYGRSLSIKM